VPDPQENTSVENSLEEAASRAFDQVTSQQAQPDPPAAVETPATPPAEAAPADPAPTTTPFTIPDEAEVEWVIDGETVKLPYKEAKRFGIREATWTKRMQSLADERKQVAAEREEAQRVAQAAQEFQTTVKAALRDRNKLAALYMAAQESEATPTPSAAPPTQAPFDLEGFKRHLIEQATPEVYTRVAQEMEQARELAATANELKSYAAGLIDKEPLLDATDEDFVLSVFNRAAQLQPKDKDEAKEFIRGVIEDKAARIKARATAAAKATAVAKASAATAVERGGSPVLPSKPDVSLRNMEDSIHDFLTNNPGLLG